MAEGDSDLQGEDVSVGLTGKGLVAGKSAPPCKAKIEMKKRKQILLKP